MNWIWDNPICRGLINCPTKGIEILFPKKVVEQAPLRMLPIPSYSRLFIRLVGISGATAVALGAYGAHAFYQRDYPDNLKQVYETANRYHFIHTLALLGVPMCRHPKLAGSLIVLGTMIFSGSCYYYALTGSRDARRFTPYGGMMLIFGWLAMVL